MKIPRFLLMSALCVLLTNCKKENDESGLSPDFLKQTIWTGTEFYLGEPVSTIGFTFTTETEGSYFWKDLSYENEGSSTLFIYHTDTKLLRLETDSRQMDSNYALIGNWILTEKRNNRLVFRQSINMGSYTMELTRVY